MSEKDQYKNRIELLQGTLDMLILQTLQWGSQHGYGIVQALRLRSGDVLQVETGSLYPALRRLERQGWVQSEEAVREHAKSPLLPNHGQREKLLASDLGRWERIVEAIGSVMHVEPSVGDRRLKEPSWFRPLRHFDLEAGVTRVDCQAICRHRPSRRA